MLRIDAEVVKKIKPPINLVIGETQNVRRDKYVAFEGELIRLVTKTKWRLESDGLWFYWYWQPDSSLGYDCGFSGVRVITLQQYKILESNVVKDLVKGMKEKKK